MKLTIATSILLTQISHTAPLSIHPRRTPHRTPIKRSLSSTTYDRPVEYNPVPNGEGLLDVEFITNSLLEPPLGDADGAEREYDDWSVDNGYEQHVELMQPPPLAQPQQFHPNRQHFQQPHQNNFNPSYNHQVMTGAQRRQSWESYAAPNTPGRRIDAKNGGVVGSPSGIGDWEYSTSYGAATSFYGQGATVGGFDTPMNVAGGGGSRGIGAVADKFRQGTTIGNFGSTHAAHSGYSRRPYQNGPDYYGNDGTVMTGAQRRERFHSLHSFEPGYVEHVLPSGNFGGGVRGAVYNDFALQETDVNNQVNAINGAGLDQRPTMNGFSKPLVPAPKTSFVMPNNNQANAINGAGLEQKTDFNGFKPLVPAPKMSNVMPPQASVNNRANVINGAGVDQKTNFNGFKPLVPAPKTPNAMPAQASLNNQATAINGDGVDHKPNFNGFKPIVPAPKMSTVMPAKGPGLNENESGSTFAKSSLAAPLKGAGPSFPIGGMGGVLKGPGLKGNESGATFATSSMGAPLKGAGPSSPIGGMGSVLKGPGLKGNESGATFAKSSMGAPLKGGLSSPVNGMGGDLGSGMLKGPGLNVNAPINGIASKTGPGASAFSKTSTTPLSNSDAGGMPAGLSGGTMKGSGGLGLKGKETSTGGFGIGMKSGLKAGPDAAFGKMSNVPSFNGGVGKAGPVAGAATFGEKSNAPSFNGAAGSASTVNGMPAGLGGGMLKGSEPSVVAKTGPGAGVLGNSSSPPSFQGAVKSSSGFPGGLGGIMKKGSGLNGEESSKGFGVGFGSSTPLKGAVESSSLVNGTPGGMGAGFMKGLGSLGLKVKESSKGGFGFGFGKTSTIGPAAATFSKTSNPPINNGAVDTAPPGLGLKTNGFASKLDIAPPVNGAGGRSSPTDGLFGVGSRPSLENKAEQSGTMPNKFKPFVPSHNIQVAEQEPSNVEDKPPSFEDFVRGQGTSVLKNGGPVFPTGQTQMAKQENTVASGPGPASNVGPAVSFNGFKKPMVPVHGTPISQQSPPGPASSFEGTTTQNKFKTFVPPTREVPMDAQDDMEQPKQDLASFLQNPRNTKRNDAKSVAASLSALSSTPTFYSDFDSSQVAEALTAEETYNDLNFAISDGAVQAMPSTSDVPMDTPARQSLPPYLSLHPIPGKGLGVITNKAFKIGEFIGNYEGEIMPEEVKDRRYLKSLQHTLTDEDRAWIQSRLDRGQTVTGTYLYGVDLDAGNVYKHFGRNKEENEEEDAPERIFVDAEDEYKSLWTRFINHASPPLDNLKPMSVPESYDGNPRVWFMAKRDIEPGEELCFDYGDDYWLEDDEVF